MRRRAIIGERSSEKSAAEENREATGEIQLVGLYKPIDETEGERYATRGKMHRVLTNSSFPPPTDLCASE